MNNINYHQKMLETLAQQDSNNKKKLLLHCCCAVCSTWVVELLSQYFHLSLFFNNSNIYPLDEYNLRLNELRRYLKEAGYEIAIITTDYEAAYQADYFTDYKDEPEGNRRCQLCIKRRMEDAFQYADSHDFDYFTTVMSISTNKNATQINQIAQELQANYRPLYLFSDFKKADGNLKAGKLVAEYQIYRQNYCGCIYSLRQPANCSLDYLPGTTTYLFQRKDMFRMNTDSALLGQMIRAKEDEIVLDVGCNNGALLLYAARGPYKELWGLDVLTEAIELADYNLKINKVENYRLFNTKVEEFEQQADVIVCNPPYFHYANNENTNDNLLLKTAKHFTEGELTDFIVALKRILKPHGRLYLVYRYDLWPKVETFFAAAGLFVSYRQKVYEARKQRYQSILLVLTKEKPVIIDEAADVVLGL